MMKKILLVYLPFCTPAAPPYSITYLSSFLKNNCSEQVSVLDLNLEFHKLQFPEYHAYYSDSSQWADYDEKTTKYKELTRSIYSESNKKVVVGEKPELFGELLAKIKDEQPDIVAFSIVYSSQAFFAYALMKELNIPCVIGGPAVNEKLIAVADFSLKNEIELLEHVTGEKKEHDALDFNVVMDYSIWNLNDYFTPSPVIPLKTSSTCYYKGCAFCSHFLKSGYFEFDLELIRKAVVVSGQKNFFFIDDNITVKRLLAMADLLKDLDVTWTCQLRPIKELSKETLKVLKESGLGMIIWGVESANDRILGLMNKGTNRKDIEQVLLDSRSVGITNSIYIMFGFPTETKEEFLETIDFLKKNEQNIDLVSTSIFGLQKGTGVYNNPEKYGITKIHETERTVLEPQLTYDLSEGLTQEQAGKLKNQYKRTIESINKYPKTMNFFREHMFCTIGQKKN